MEEGMAADEASAPSTATATSPPQSSADPAAGGGKDEEEEDTCRYCLGPFEEEEVKTDPKVSPCNCRGGQEFCHLSCLRQWQRSVLVTQPTHPAFYEHDERQFTCNVCASPFSIAPPSRAEMMAQFTGPELAGLLDVGCLIVCEPKTSEYMSTVLRNNAMIRQIQDMRHWVESVYLITSVELDGASDGEDGIIAINLSRPAFENTDPDVYETAFRESEHLKTTAITVGRRAVTTGLKAEHFNGKSVVVVGRTATGRVAVRIHGRKKRIAIPPTNLDFTDPDPPPVSVSHYIGGPCYPMTSTGLAVLTATHKDELADYNVRVGGTQGGLWVTGDLDDVAAVARADAQRLGTDKAYVDAYWGDARWSRTQLLGEIARGSWGMCRAEIADVSTAPPAHGHAVDGALTHRGWSDVVQANPPRLVYAQKSEMTDQDIHGDRPQMTAEEEDAAARELNARMEETRRRLRAQQLAQQAAEADRTGGGAGSSGARASREGTPQRDDSADPPARGD